jgi:hypothetical protein
MGGVRTRTDRWLRALAVASATALTAACLKADAKTPGPPLAVPDPPSRLAIPVPVEPPDPPAATPVSNASADKPVTTSSAPPPKPVTTTKPVTAGSTTQDSGPPAPGQVLLPGGGAEVEARAKERLDRAEKDLRRVNRASLSADAREQYDSADRFIRMARDAVTSRNFVFALSCADKAATLAALLLK